MQIEHLYDLLEVVRMGSINKASGHLHMQQQNLSRLILFLTVWDQSFLPSFLLRWQHLLRR